MGSFPQLEEALDLTAAEKELLKKSHTGTTALINESRVLSQVYTVRHLRQSMQVLDETSVHLQVAIRESTSEVIESNEALAQESRRYARALNWLTAVLAAATLALVYVQATS